MDNPIKFFVRFFFYCTKDVCKIFPRNRQKWIFGAKDGFRDNPKYLFIKTTENNPEIRSIWISKNRTIAKSLKKQGYEAYYWLSFMGLFHTISAKVFISDHCVADINPFLSEGAFYVNLWHGSSVKRVRWQAPEYFVHKYKLRSSEEMRTSFKFKVIQYPVMFRKSDLCLAPSTIQARNFFAPMMDIPLKNCIVGVYPRSQLLIKGKEAAENFIKKHESRKTMEFVNICKRYKKVYIYMPTWRNDGRNFIQQAGFQWQRLNDVLRSRNEFFILKLHPFTKLDMSEVASYSNIGIYPSSSDIYTILPYIDCLITDYSSIYTDFLIMDKEIILYTFDYDEYVKGSYELSEYDNYFIGRRANDFNQLLDFIKSDEDFHIPKEKRDFLMEFYWDNNNKDIDLVQEIKKRLK